MPPELTQRFGASRGSPSELGGCINDAKCMRYLLISKFGFRSEDITMLTDDQSHPGAWPTKQNMIANMQRLVGDARPGDSLVFHYSGGCPCVCEVRTSPQLPTRRRWSLHLIGHCAPDTIGLV